MDVHQLHLLHHHGQVPHVHVQPHVQQHGLLSQRVRRFEQQQGSAVQVLHGGGGQEDGKRRDRVGLNLDTGFQSSVEEVLLHLCGFKYVRQISKRVSFAFVYQQPFIYILRYFVGLHGYYLEIFCVSAHATLARGALDVDVLVHALDMAEGGVDAGDDGFNLQRDGVQTAVQRGEALPRPVLVVPGGHI